MIHYIYIYILSILLSPCLLITTTTAQVTQQYTVNLNLTYTWSLISNTGMAANMAFASVYNKTTNQLMLVSGQNTALYNTADYNEPEELGGLRLTQLMSVGTGAASVSNSTTILKFAGRGGYIFVQNSATGLYYLGFGSVSSVGTGYGTPNGPNGTFSAGFYNDLYVSADLLTWSAVPVTAPASYTGTPQGLGVRAGAGAVIVNNTLYVFGGYSTSTAQPGSSVYYVTPYCDVWTLNLVTLAGWKPLVYGYTTVGNQYIHYTAYGCRYGMMMTTVGNTMYMMGGLSFGQITGYAPYYSLTLATPTGGNSPAQPSIDMNISGNQVTAMSDIWSSTDGLNWSLLRYANWAGRYFATLSVYNNVWIVTGGQNNVKSFVAPSQNSYAGDNYYSLNYGVTWVFMQIPYWFTSRSLSSTAIIDYGTSQTMYLLGGSVYNSAVPNSNLSSTIADVIQLNVTCPSTTCASYQTCYPAMFTHTCVNSTISTQITLSTTNTSVIAGSNITYTAVLTNNGSVTLTNVRFTPQCNTTASDTVYIIDAAGNTMVIPAGSNATSRQGLASVPPTASYVYTFIITTNATTDVNQVIDCYAFVRSTDQTGLTYITSQNASHATRVSVVPIPVIGVQVTISTNVTTVYAGNSIPYTAVYVNNGTVTLTNVVVSVTCNTPDGVTSTSRRIGTLTPTSSYGLPMLLPTNSQANVPGVVDCWAYVSQSDQTGVTNANSQNSAHASAVTVLPVPVAAYTLTMSTSNTSVYAGSNIVYTTRFSNTGNVNLTTAKIVVQCNTTAADSASVIYSSGVSIPIAVGGRASPRISINLVAASFTYTYTMVLTTNATADFNTVIDCSSYVTSSDQTGPTNATSLNATHATAVTVLPAPVVAPVVNISTSDTSVYAGSNITYTIVFTNNGTVTLTNAALTERCNTTAADTVYLTDMYGNVTTLVGNASYSSRINITSLQPASNVTYTMLLQTNATTDVSTTIDCWAFMSLSDQTGITNTNSHNATHATAVAVLPAPITPAASHHGAQIPISTGDPAGTVAPTSVASTSTSPTTPAPTTLAATTSALLIIAPSAVATPSATAQPTSLSPTTVATQSPSPTVATTLMSTTIRPTSLPPTTATATTTSPTTMSATTSSVSLTLHATATSTAAATTTSATSQSTTAPATSVITTPNQSATAVTTVMPTTVKPTTTTTSPTTAAATTTAATTQQSTPTVPATTVQPTTASPTTTATSAPLPPCGHPPAPGSCPPGNNPPAPSPTTTPEVTAAVNSTTLRPTTPAVTTAATTTRPPTSLHTTFRPTTPPTQPTTTAAVTTMSPVTTHVSNVLPTTPAPTAVTASTDRPVVLLSITNINPQVAYMSGGQQMTLIGTGLYNVQAFSINGAATSFSYATNTTSSSVTGTGRRLLQLSNSAEPGTVLYFTAPMSAVAGYVSMSITTLGSGVYNSPGSTIQADHVLDYVPAPYTGAMPVSSAGQAEPTLTYLSVSSVYPSAVSQAGDVAVTIYGTGFANVLELSIDDANVQFATQQVTVQGTTQTVILFTAPPNNNTGYHNISISTAGDAATYTVAGTASTDVFYTTVVCPINTWLPGNVGYQCQPCPTGGTCPGGGRCWPNPGYWSTTEFSTPVQCQLAIACPGANGLSSNAMYVAGGGRDTEVCSAGYAGQYCSQCNSNYYQLINKCIYCGDEALQIGTLLLVLCLAFSIFGVIAYAVARMDNTPLASFVGNIIILQQFVALAQLALQELPGSQQGFATFVSALSGVNFDIRLVKPGCLVGRLSFLAFFWMTIALVLVGAVVFRYGVRWRVNQLQKQHLATLNSADVNTLDTAVQVSRAFNYDREYNCRLVHSRFILAWLVYLRVTSNIFTALNCIYIPGPNDRSVLVLAVELQTQCYTGAHLLSSVFIWPLAVAYVVGFPLLCAHRLHANFSPAKLQASLDSLRRSSMMVTKHSRHASAVVLMQFDKQRSNKYAFLYRQLKKKHYWFRLTSLVQSFLFAGFTSLITSETIKLLLLGVLFFINVCIVSAIKPFAIEWKNTVAIGVQLAGLAQSIIYLTIIKLNELPAPKADYNTAATGMAYQAPASNATTILSVVAALTALAVVVVIATNHYFQNRLVKPAAIVITEYVRATSAKAALRRLDVAKVAPVTAEQLHPTLVDQAEWLQYADHADTPQVEVLSPSAAASNVQQVYIASASALSYDIDVMSSADLLTADTIYHKLKAITTQSNPPPVDTVVACNRVVLPPMRAFDVIMAAQRQRLARRQSQLSMDANASCINVMEANTAG